MGRSADVPREQGCTGGDDSGATILHVYIDAFFANVEIRRCPDLGRPIPVGGAVRGVVAVVSYEARKYGVHIAMSMGQALRLCPRAVVLHPDCAAYSAASTGVIAILRAVIHIAEPLSLDEAFRRSQYHEAVKPPGWNGGYHPGAGRERVRAHLFGSRSPRTSSLRSWRGRPVNPAGWWSSLRPMCCNFYIPCRSWCSEVSVSELC